MVPSVVYENPSRPVYPYQQQPVGNTGFMQSNPTIHSSYDALPPSYEVATTKILPWPSSTPSAPPPPGATYQVQRRSRI